MTRAAACGGEHRSAARCYEFGVGADSCGSRPDYSATGEAGKRFEEKEGAVAGTRENGAGEVQGAFGSGKAVAGARVDSGGAEADRRIFVFVAEADVVCAEFGGRRSGGVGDGGGAAQAGGAGGAEEYGGGGGLRTARGGVGADGREGSGGIAGFVWIEGAGAESVDSGDV